MSRKIKRKVLNDLTLKGWCAVCADYTANEKIHTGLPGIQCYKCKCGARFQANLLEDNEDELEIDGSLKLPL